MEDQKVIVVDEDNLRPMSFDGDQFCYVGPLKLTSVARNKFKVEVYSKSTALQLIKKHDEFRRVNNFMPNNFMLMLVGVNK